MYYRIIKGNIQSLLPAVLFFTGLMVGFLPLSGICQEDVINIANHRQIFVDHHLISNMEGEVSLKLHKPDRKEVVMVHDEPWEGNTCGYHTIFKDGNIYKMYYRASNFKNGEQTHPQFTCYAISTDGIHWEKPELGIVKFEGSKNNNIIWKGKGAHNFTPFLDKNPEASKKAKYKAVGGTGDDGLFAFQSSDGIYWERMQKEPILTDGAFDSQNLVFWDSVRSEYRAYFRDFRNGIRGIKTATSKDFKNWSEPMWLEYGDAPTEHLYTNQIMPYQRAPHIFIGFPSRYLPDRESMVEGLFMSSRDGVNFKRWEEAIIRPGRNQERWHNRSNYIWWGLVPTKSNLPGAPVEFSLYSNERYYMEEGVKIRRFTYRPDGFVSLHADYDGGKVTTKPLKFSGDQLLINMATAGAGSVNVAILDESKNAMPGFTKTDSETIYGDNISRKVEWKSDRKLEALEGKTVHLVFYLKDADLYSFKFDH